MKEEEFRSNRAPSGFDRLEMSRALSSFRLWDRVFVKDELNSTSDFLRDSLGPAPGVIVVARRQRKGRGKRGRKWYSPPGGLWLSFSILSPDPGWLGAVRLIALKSIRDALGSFGLEAEIRFPNDLFLEGKKVAGVLLETCGRCCIVGLGVNVNNDPDLLPDELMGKVSSASAVLDEPLPLELVAGRFLADFEVKYLGFKKKFLRPDAEVSL